ncbi:MAG: hypothetical protein Q8K91_06020 [Hylemonella sp.]|nr:hypothetical protein [Hylemonella sp.]MDP1936745.1 hypothetical protein [Hylemonella sp.]
MSKQTFDVICIVVLILASYPLVSFGREDQWFGSAWLWYAVYLFFAKLAHLLVYRPLAKNFFPEPLEKDETTKENLDKS